MRILTTLRTFIASPVLRTIGVVALCTFATATACTGATGAVGPAGQNGEAGPPGATGAPGDLEHPASRAKREFPANPASLDRLVKPAFPRSR